MGLATTAAAALLQPVSHGIDWAGRDLEIEWLARLSAHSRSGVVGRTGSYDFGGTPEDQAISTRAYLANGLSGNSDAFDAGAPPVPGGQMYWCSQQDRTAPIRNLRDAELVQLKITKDASFTSAGEMNDWFNAARESCRGSKKSARRSV